MSGETGPAQSGWTIDTLREHLSQQVSYLRRILDERYATQTKALDAAFKAAEQAVTVALANAEKATVKAETAANARFESVNEFRQALSDQTATFIPRPEYYANHTALADRMGVLSDRVVAMELRLTSRLDLGQGAAAGAGAAHDHSRADATFRQSTVSAVIAAVSVLVAIGLGIFAALHG